MVPSIFSSFTLFLFLSPCICSARDNMTSTTPLREEMGDTLVSAGERFELGFFTINGSDDVRRYLGIWYYRYKPQTVVWVANREHPLRDSSGVFALGEDGNLQVFDANNSSYFSTRIDFSSSSSSSSSLSFSRRLKLIDSGNLVLIQEGANGLETLWQSFDYPTDTFLPGMKMTENLKLSSWKSQVDPAEGSFTFQLEEETSHFVIMNGLIKHWTSEESGGMPKAIKNYLSNFTRLDRSPSEKSPFNLSRIDRSLSDYNSTRIRLDIEGELQYLANWSLLWWEPRDKCSVRNACGKFGSCNLYNKLACKCLPGFEPTSPETWNNGDFSGGCIRSSAVCGKNDTFLSLKMMRVGQQDPPFVVQDEKQCREECLHECQCQAYSYIEELNVPWNRQPSNNMCYIWRDDLKDLQEEYSYEGHDLFVRVSISDIEPKPKSCEPCGTNVIPYPLSTGSDCGDPMYFRFYCDNSTGRLSFKTQNDTYKVTTINPDTRAFLIQENVDGCNSSARGEIQKFKLSFPFKLNAIKPWCDATAGNFSSDVSSKGMVEIDIGWEPPPEPICTSSVDCEDWPNSTCNVRGDGTSRCLCDSNFRWDGIALNCTQGGPSRKKKPLSLIVGATISSVIVLSSIFLYICILMRKKARRRESRENAERNAAVLYGTEKRVKSLIDTEEFKEEDKKGIDVPFFDLESILAATDCFSEANKLGRGGFGPVYKGKFPGGQEIAIKRLSSVSGQGLEEFKNEVILIARLQHRNLVRLVGYCIKGEEKILLYEYMPNKSLDSFIFDRNLGMLLNWEMRFNIILGVARGLLYLHQDSRLRIIHRDMKTSNILLDEEMNPKISDFGLARMFEGKQTEGSTNRVIGTYGYMSPEYALDGLFSVKSDVFSFGVVVLEILSGRRNTGYFNSEETRSLLPYAWRLWREERALDLMDETLHESCNTNEFLRCVNVALLCVQDDPADRPTMSNVVVMVSSETANFPAPKKPAFVVQRGLPGTDTASSSSSIKQERSIETTTALDEGR